ncbi:hypothetical protein O7632_07735 [Solwaraspora sp. WMMD406]|uniref:hypothetical protein n=1 Tax=Solwaraspora sp. WMMD406 TaxID=3016095 RepID=UPI002415D0E1|nr:hypothetical protein [Solwaraspora sp. WMMD406]MDG4763997.1 hypothetical protein [Solwaraspora sp. WMMD406]
MVEWDAADSPLEGIRMSSSERSVNSMITTRSSSPPDVITINGETAEIIDRGPGYITVASSLGDLEISVDTSWWGFTIHLNSVGVSLLTELIGGITDVVCKISPRRSPGRSR